MAEATKLDILKALMAKQSHPQHILATFAELDYIGLHSKEELTEAFKALAEDMGQKLVVNVENRQAGLIINWAPEPMVLFTWKKFD